MTVGERYGEVADEPPAGAGYRTYEVYQRERVGETTNLIRPRDLIGDTYLDDPYPLLTTLREHYPCYRDWIGNRFWITRYDDVTSVLADEANYETRSKRWRYDRPDLGRDLLGADEEVDVLWARARRIDAALAGVVERTVDDVAAVHAAGGTVDLAADVAARVPVELWVEVLDLPDRDGHAVHQLARDLWRLQRGLGWHDADRAAGLATIDRWIVEWAPLVEQRRADPGDDLISAIAGLGGSAGDVVATVLEADHETLHGGLANLWLQLLSHPDQLDALRDQPRLAGAAWLETLRHSPPTLDGERYTRHEVERFGRLLPHGALLTCSAAAANRDPRVFAEPDAFDITRKDLCQREPRGQYRADGLPSGVAVGLGRPSIHPAVPKERPRSTYALTRDIAVAVTLAVLEACPGLRLSVPDGEAAPRLRSLRLGEMRTCWRLPVTW